MKKFQIEIEEISQRVEEIEAKDLEEALDIVEEKYDSGEIELDYNDFKAHEVREYRNCVREKDLEKDAIIDINYGKAIILEKESNIALIKQIGVKENPYVVVSGLNVHKSGTYFDWIHGSHFNNLTEASKTFEERVDLNKNQNDIIFSELGQATLNNYNISKFENVDEIFSFLMDDDIKKEDLINMLSDKMKEEIVLSHVDNTREEDGNFYFGQDLYFSEEDINERVIKIDKILQELKIKNIKPYDVIELIEENENGAIKSELTDKVLKNIKAAGYEKTIQDFINYINEEVENIKDEETEEMEE